jgi:hypothetical protein
VGSIRTPLARRRPPARLRVEGWLGGACLRVSTGTGGGWCDTVVVPWLGTSQPKQPPPGRGGHSQHVELPVLRVARLELRHTKLRRVLHAAVVARVVALAHADALQLDLLFLGGGRLGGWF